MFLARRVTTAAIAIDGVELSLALALHLLVELSFVALLLLRLWPPHWLGGHSPFESASAVASPESPLFGAWRSWTLLRALCVLGALGALASVAASPTPTHLVDRHAWLGAALALGALVPDAALAALAALVPSSVARLGVALLVGAQVALGLVKFAQPALWVVVGLLLGALGWLRRDALAHALSARGERASIDD